MWTPSHFPRDPVCFPLPSLASSGLTSFPCAFQDLSGVLSRTLHAGPPGWTCLVVTLKQTRSTETLSLLMFRAEAAGVGIETSGG